MAAFTITIANTVGVFGPSEANRWGASNWNAFTWAYSTDLRMSTGKVVANTLSPTSTAAKAAVHYLSESLTLDSSVAVAFSRFISNSLTVTGDMLSQVLQDGSGYTYNFPDRATDGEDRDETTWTDSSGASTTWTPPSTPSTTWS